MADQIEVNPNEIIGELYVRLGLLTKYAQGLEHQLAEKTAQVEAQAAQIEALQNPTVPGSDEETPAEDTKDQEGVLG